MNTALIFLAALLLSAFSCYGKPMKPNGAIDEPITADEISKTLGDEFREEALMRKIHYALPKYGEFTGAAAKIGKGQSSIGEAEDYLWHMEFDEVLLVGSTHFLKYPEIAMNVTIKGLKFKMLFSRGEPAGPHDFFSAKDHCVASVSDIVTEIDDNTDPVILEEILKTTIGNSELFEEGKAEVLASICHLANQVFTEVFHRIAPNRLQKLPWEIEKEIVDGNLEAIGEENAVEIVEIGNEIMNEIEEENIDKILSAIHELGSLLGK